jgi:hypothetical protein
MGLLLRLLRRLRGLERGTAWLRQLTRVLFETGRDLATAGAHTGTEAAIIGHASLPNGFIGGCIAGLRSCDSNAAGEMGGDRDAGNDIEQSLLRLCRADKSGHFDLSCCRDGGDTGLFGEVSGQGREKFSRSGRKLIGPRPYQLGTPGRMALAARRLAGRSRHAALLCRD